MLGIHDGSSNMKISQCLDAILGTVQRIQKEMEESYDKYISSEASLCSDKKWTVDFVGEIQARIDKDQ